MGQGDFLKCWKKWLFIIAVAYSVRVLFAWIHFQYDPRRIPDLYNYQKTACTLYEVRQGYPEWKPYFLCRLFYTDWELPPELSRTNLPYLENKGGYRHSFLLSLIYGELVFHSWGLVLAHQLVVLGILFLVFWYGRSVSWILIALLEPFAWFWSSSWLKESFLFPFYSIIWVHFYAPVPVFFLFLAFFWNSFIRPLATLWLFVCAFFAWVTRLSRISLALVFFCCVAVPAIIYVLPYIKMHLHELELNYYYSYYVITEEPGREPIRGEYAYWFGDRDLSSWDGVVKAIPIGLYNGFLNPLFPKLPLDSWKDFISILVIIRNVITIILLFGAIYYLVRYKTYRKEEVHVGFWLFLYAIVVGLEIGLSHTHVGAILRYQAAYLPAFWIACLSCIPCGEVKKLAGRMKRLFKIV